MWEFLFSADCLIFENLLLPKFQLFLFQPIFGIFAQFHAVFPSFFIRGLSHPWNQLANGLRRLQMRIRINDRYLCLFVCCLFVFLFFHFKPIFSFNNHTFHIKPFSFFWFSSKESKNWLQMYFFFRFLARVKNEKNRYFCRLGDPVF